MDDENFWADVQVEEPEPGVFVPVLVMGFGSDPDQVSRLALGGEFASAEAALHAAQASIDAMAIDDEPGAAGAPRPPAGA